jgi:RHS repeat-associated protein
VTDASGEVYQHIEYFAFGETFVEERSNPNEIIYKFNAKELDEETGLYYYGARYMEPQLSIFFGVDRFAEKYPGLTPYHYAANNPVKYIDINGDSIWISFTSGFLGLGGRTSVRYENGNLYNKDGSDYTGKTRGFLGKVTDALNNLNAVSEGSSRLRDLERSSFHFTIQRGTNEFIPDNIGASAIALNSQLSGYPIPTGATIGSGGIVKWKPGDHTGDVNTSGNTKRPSFISLGHELLGHSYTSNQGMSDRRRHSAGFAMDEFNASHVENLIRSQWSLPLRTNYGSESLLKQNGPNKFYLYNAKTGYLYNHGNASQRHYSGSYSGR